MMAVKTRCRYPAIWSNTAVLQFSSDFLENGSVFSCDVSRHEGKQVVLLLEYGLNDVPSFICLVIGHVFPLSPFLHAVCDVPSRLRLAKHSERRNLLLFFSLHIFFGHWIFPLLQPWRCLLCIRARFGQKRVECFFSNPAVVGRTSASPNTVIFSVSRGRFVFDHQFWSRIKILWLAGRRKKLQGSHFWTINSHISCFIYGNGVLLCLSSRQVTSGMRHHLCNY